MKKQLCHFVLWVFVATLPIHAAGSEPGPALSSAVKANNSFTLDLYARLARQPGNVAFSPLSIDTALAIACAGARGQTANQMAKTLGFPGETVAIHAGLAALLKALQESSMSGSQCVLANSIWIQQGRPLLRPFEHIVRIQYGAGINQVDFRHATESARSQINSWISGQTQQQIQEIVPPGLLDADTGLVLANAVYFKGRWWTPFDKSKTTNAPFHLNSGESICVPMMKKKSFFGYVETGALQALKLNYYSNQFSLLILLPRKVQGLVELEQTLTVGQIDQLLQQMKQTPPADVHEVRVSLPRFRCASQLSLAKPLQQLGMVDAFSPGRADFSGVEGQKDLYAKAVLHQASVTVDEEGTQATAGSAVGFTLLGPSDEFKADHPFLFLICHQPTGAIVFMGRMANPLQEAH